MLPWRHQSPWTDFLLGQLFCGSSSLSAAARLRPRRPPLWHQTSTGKEVEKEWICMYSCAWTQAIWRESPSRASSTCGFCRNVLWLAQPPQRFNSGSAFLVQLPKCTTSCHVLWILISEVLMRRQRSASVKDLHQSVNDILWMWSGNALLHFKRGDTLHTWMVKELNHSPKLSIILYCDAKVAPLHIANLWPFFRADKQQAIQMKILLWTATRYK